MLYKNNFELNGNIYELFIKDARSFMISPITDFKFELDEFGEITKVSCNDNFLIEKGTDYKIILDKGLINIKSFTTSYPIYKILKTDGSIIMNSNKSTVTRTFALAILFDKKTNIGFDQYLINAFSKDVITLKEQNVEDNTKIYLLYKFFPYESYYQVENYLREHPYLESFYDVDPYSVMFSFNIPSSYKETMSIIMRGKYSSLSETYKEKLLNFHGFSKTGSLGKILYKDAGLRKQMEINFGQSIPSHIDLFEIPNPKFEWYGNY